MPGISNLYRLAVAPAAILALGSIYTAAIFQMWFWDTLQICSSRFPLIGVIVLNLLCTDMIPRKVWIPIAWVSYLPGPLSLQLTLPQMV